VARYRASIPYLAIAPRETFGDPETWAFFAGREAGIRLGHAPAMESGRNVSGQWVPPPARKSTRLSPGRTPRRRAFVTWNAPLHTWLLLYNCAPWTVEARFAPSRGTVVAAVVMLSAAQDPSVICTLIMSDTGCPGLVRRNYWTLPNGNPWPGIFYAPFVMDRFTRDATPAGAVQPSGQ